MQAKRTLDSLPNPDAESLAHSAKVAACIRRAIEDGGGSISFAEFMQLALYAPALGYYVAGAAKFGAAGDFVTAPEISPLFGRVLAGQCAGVLRQLPAAAVLELGAGRGTLAVQVLSTLAELGIDVRRYMILEVSPDLRERQEAFIRAECPQLWTKVEWVDGLPERFDGVVIANEVADALPVERFRKSGGGVLQCRAELAENGFQWTHARAPRFLQEAVRHIEERLGTILADGYESEVSNGLPGWVRAIADRIGTGFVFLFDYGVSRREYYAPDRGNGWLRCHFRHRAHADPFIYPGIQDITAWVDFTAVAEAAADAGLDIAGFVSQAHFLLHGGLERELDKTADLPLAAQLELARQVKTLTLPGEMGERVKCIGLSRGRIELPASFAIADRAHAL
jgi:SAM-dependent MidA family methyltransferase